MPLHTKVDSDGPDGLRLAGEGESVPKHRMPEMTCEIVHDEPMLDGNARMNARRTRRA